MKHNNPIEKRQWISNNLKNQNDRNAHDQNNNNGFQNNEESEGAHDTRNNMVEVEPQT